ncbi:hypothetical protein CONPUDRAFT_81601 [Coniophora puteana RWD-64-598 SS2]|uniref:Pentacotripeptide-repeat region of PRORP domain-containing protein n=1 Tax=Coniophora puteana (strain RWD-64-598) TaxID=741705 RepID=A0A5M3MS53_CONPW|nr:uncharacterized protein CONPUDRAFT_81601 [Coniophora puteana RWD-64-598 SS2]EIW81989.1 hypothetical protein CONPUDRAFT_81601 [Coniophora puteana RWD-64-598 SS2]
MLPKVANSLFLHTSRAAAAVQNQTSQTIWNLLQSTGSNGTTLNTWNTAGSSSWGNAGGAKFNAGSRFQYYTNSGRALTQANASSAQDGNSARDDEREEIIPRHVSIHTPRRSRPRSHSLSVARHGQQERAETFGVLHTVQMHVRSRHAFASSPAEDQEQQTSAGLIHASPSADSSRPVLVRRNSTSSHATAQDVTEPFPLSPPPTPKLSSTDPATPQSVLEPTAITAFQSAVNSAVKAKDGARVISEVQALVASPANHIVQDFNAALQALYDIRQPGDPLNLMLDTYNNMIKRSLNPNFRTYHIMMLALSERDEEVFRAIVSLEARAKRREFGGRDLAEVSVTDAARVKQLKAENNFNSAMAMFQACTISGGSPKIGLKVYHSLLRTCARHANIDAALAVFGQMESRRDVLTSVAYEHILATYANANDIQGALEVFKEFCSACKEERVMWRTVDPVNQEVVPADIPAVSQVTVWNKMIEAYCRAKQPENAIRLLETMIDENKDASSAHVPAPASSTYTTLIAGFIKSGDSATALSWFDNLLKQERTARYPWEPSSVPYRPDQIAWYCIIDMLAQEGMVDDLNRLFFVHAECAERDGLSMRPVDHLLVVEANVAHLTAHPDLSADAARPYADFLARYAVPPRESNLYPKTIVGSVQRAVEHLVRYGQHDQALDVMVAFFKYEDSWVRQVVGRQFTSERQQDINAFARSVTSSFIEPVIASAALATPPKWQTASRMMQHAHLLTVPQDIKVAAYIIHAYTRALEQGMIQHVSLHEGQLLLQAAVALDDALYTGAQLDIPDLQNHGLLQLLTDLSNFRVPLHRVHMEVISDVSDRLYTRCPRPAVDAFLATDKAYAALFQPPAPRASPPPPAMEMHPPVSGLSIDPALSRYVDEWHPRHPSVSAHVAHARLQDGLAQGKLVHPSTIARLIGAMGRAGDLAAVRSLYETAQMVLRVQQQQGAGARVAQSHAWLQIEDHMVVAHAHGGDLASANAHRARILHAGCVPSADAYGSLIEHVRDTTDDTASALALFAEAQAAGTTPNTYLYNTIISKLAKARKADHALELFQQMKAALGLRPTSITYGAVIAACARVGDAQSAEQLFSEMAAQPNFRARIPPYNTMMQLYTHTKPNRERVLHYYNALLEAGIQPSAHTYKLLIDAYGTIEPLDLPAMEQVFETVQNDRAIRLQGTHWAALVNAYGCVAKDVHKAISVFDSIASHPSSRTASAASPMPDAVAYEAIINVLVTHKRMDLVPAYLARLDAAHVHRTAYIANLLIRGYAAAGDLAAARAVFEALADPPSGRAAPGNHVPHDSSSPSVSGSGSASGPASPVLTPASASNETSYREPSTWEAMFRAELGSGNRDRAVRLLERLQERHFPPAVYNRIKGIMLDDAVSPWPSSPSPSSSP